jgi:hypothetical protein
MIPISIVNTGGEAFLKEPIILSSVGFSGLSLIILCLILIGFLIVLRRKNAKKNIAYY